MRQCGSFRMGIVVPVYLEDSICSSATMVDS
jgi:hypothetical protein